MRKVNGRFWALAVTLFCMSLISSLCNGKILIQTGFENDDVGEIPQEPADAWQASGVGFEVSGDIVKTGSKSLAAIGGGGDQALGVLFETQSQVVTAEFWLYIDGIERSVTFFVQDPNVGLTDWGNSGPYVNWIADGVRHYPGAWEDIGAFASGEWHYVRFVIDVGGASYDMYMGGEPGETHAGDPIGADLGFRTAITPPAGKVLFNSYDLVTPAYIDDLLIYEGDVIPEGIFAVEPADKLTATWGKIKRISDF